MAKSKVYKGDAAPLVANPFAQLLGGDAGGDAEDQDPAPRERDPDPKPEPKPERVRGRVVVRREKKGRGGKTVTLVDGLSRTLAQEFLPKLKRDLGCSGKVDGALLVLGTKDHVRVEQWLCNAGVPNSVLGN